MANGKQWNWQRPYRSRYRQYTVCSCGRWIYNDRIGRTPVCTCGAPWQAGPQAQSQSMGNQQFLVQAIWTAVAGVLGDDAKAKIVQEFPVLREVDQQREHWSGLQKRYKEASREFRELAEKKKRLVEKVEGLQDQLDKARGELADTETKLKEASKRHDEELKDFQAKVNEVTGRVKEQMGSHCEREQAQHEQEHGEPDSDADMEMEENRVAEEIRDNLAPDKRALVEHWQKVVGKRRKCAATSPTRTVPTEDQAHVDQQSAQTVAEAMAKQHKSG